MSVEEHKTRTPQRVAFAVITVSDTRNEANDSGGKLARELIEARGFTVASASIVRDEAAAIRAAIGAAAKDDAVDAVLLTGGTGISLRDVTPQAALSMCETTLEGFGELFRALSYQEIGAAAMLSRAVAGVHGLTSAKKRTPVFCLPGSPKAVRLGLDKLVLPEIGHVLAELRR